MPRLRAFFAFSVCFILFIYPGYTGMGPLTVHPDNPRYFADSDGKIVYLTGSHTWANFQERGIEGETPDFDFAQYVDFLKKYNHNFIRLWMWEHATWMQFQEKSVRIRYTPLPYLRSGPGRALDGRPKFDLSQFNPTFFERLRNRVFTARERGIYVGVMLFQGFSVEQKGKKAVDPKRGNPWDGHPFNRKNNINHIDGDLNGDGEGEEVHTLANPKITQLQEAYVKKIIDTLNGFDNIIWEISNESHGLSTRWQYHMIRFIKDYEQTKTYQHPVWMSFQYSGYKKGTNADLFASPAEAVSPNGEDGFRDDPPDKKGSKIVLTDTDHIDPWLKKIDPTWVWKSFTRGLHPILMDWYYDVRSPEGDEETLEKMRVAMGQTLLYAKIINLAKMIPHNELCSTGYCLADPGHEYLAYQPRSEKLFWIDLPAGSYRLDLFSPRQNKIITSIAVQSDKRKKQMIPIFFYGDVVAHIQKKSFPLENESQ